MLCPHCKVALTIADRQGIEIDFCQTCRGVWLDRGELDKILDRTAAMIPVTGIHGGFGAPSTGGWRHDDDDDDDDRRRQYGQAGYPQQGQRRKRESWLGDLFDFD